jgi:hypothetical protein
MLKRYILSCIDKISADMIKRGDNIIFGDPLLVCADT